MPIIEFSAEQFELEHQAEIEEREWTADREEARRQHELNLAKIKATVPQRHKTIVRIGLALAKGPALVILAITLPILILRGKDIPPALADFMNL